MGGLVGGFVGGLVGAGLARHPVFGSAAGLETGQLRDETSPIAVKSVSQKYTKIHESKNQHVNNHK